MKVSANLLKAIAIGVALGTSSVGCGLVDEEFPIDNERCTEECTTDCVEHRQTDGPDYSCPGCGLG